MIKRTVGLTITLLLSIGLVTSVAWAYFTDTESSSGNTLTAGTLDLKTNDVDGVTQTLYSTNMKPGDSIGPATIQLKNAGTVNGSTLDMAFSYVENDGSPNAVNKSADDTAAMMEVTTLNYGGSSLLSGVSDLNGNGYKDIQDLKNANLAGQSGISASATKSFEITIRLRSETGNDFQSDGITLTMTFTLNH